MLLHVDCRFLMPHLLACLGRSKPRISYDVRFPTYVGVFFITWLLNSKDPSVPLFQHLSIKNVFCRLCCLLTQTSTKTYCWVGVPELVHWYWSHEGSWYSFLCKEIGHPFKAFSAFFSISWYEKFLAPDFK